MSPLGLHLKPVDGDISIFPGYTASRQETYLMKVAGACNNRDHRFVSYCNPETGKAGQQFLEIQQLKTSGRGKTIVFKNLATGQEDMRIEKECHFSKPDVYHGFATGREVWTLGIKERWGRDQYDLTIFPEDDKPYSLPVEPKVDKQERTIMVDGSPASTIKQQGTWSHWRREDVIHIAQGMDILLGIGVGWCQAEKSKEKQEAVVIAANA